MCLQNAGCCGLASYFCGPDRSRWVTQDYREPIAALETFLEAVRREHTRTIAEALSEDARRHYGLTGIVETALAWERLKAQVPGLHVLGDAAIPPLVREPDGRLRADLDAAGHHVVLWLVEQPFWVVYYQVEGEPHLDRQGSYVDAATFQKMVVVASDLATTIDARVQSERLPELKPSQVREVRFGHDWKVDRFDMPDSR